MEGSPAQAHFWPRWPCSPWLCFGCAGLAAGAWAFLGFGDLFEPPDLLWFISKFLQNVAQATTEEIAEHYGGFKMP